MSLTLRTTLGCTEAVIADDGGLKEFYRVANILSQDLDVNYSHKEDDFDTIDWTQALPEEKETLELLRARGAKMTKELN